MYQLDWPIFSGDGSPTLRIDRINGQVQFSKLVRSNSSIYTTKISDEDRMAISANKPVENFFFQ